MLSCIIAITSLAQRQPARYYPLLYTQTWAGQGIISPFRLEDTNAHIY